MRANVGLSIKNKLRLIRDFPKSVYVNFRCLPINQAIKLPIRVKWNTKIGILQRNSIIFNVKKLDRYIVKFGYRGGQFISENKSYLSISKGGKLILNEQINFAEGFKIEVEGGILSIGKNFYSNRNIMIECQKKIEICNDVLIGWGVSLRDTDGHTIIYNGIPKEYLGTIKIGNHVWIGSDTTVLKNANIPDGSVVACNSLVSNTEKYKNNCVVAGIPAKVIKENVEWRE